MNLKQLIGLEARDRYDDAGELIVATCPEPPEGCGLELTERDVLGGVPGRCPRCGVNLVPPEDTEGGEA